MVHDEHDLSGHRAKTRPRPPDCMALGAGVVGLCDCEEVLTAVDLSQAVGQWGVGLLAGGIASIGVGLGYRRDKRAAQRHPLSDIELDELRLWATTGRFAGKTPKMERYRKAADWRYSERRERAFLISGAAVGVLGLLAIVLS